MRFRHLKVIISELAQILIILVPKGIPEVATVVIDSFVPVVKFEAFTGYKKNKRKKNYSSFFFSTHIDDSNIQLTLTIKRVIATNNSASIIWHAQTLIIFKHAGSNSTKF